MIRSKEVLYELGKDANRWISHNPRMAGTWKLVLNNFKYHWQRGETVIMVCGDCCWFKKSIKEE